jgi:cell division protein FtsI (penicillin-binding protein 3)
MEMAYQDSAAGSRWSYVEKEDNRVTARKLGTARQSVPNVKGMGLKDAVYLLENMNLRVVARGVGKVSQQSLQAGTGISIGQTIYIDLN